MPTTTTLTSKYLEDSQGNKFAPITTPNAVRFPDGDTLNDRLVQADWNESSSSDPAYILNKPSALPANGGNAATVNNHSVQSDVPANAVFTDTTYSTMVASGSSHAGGLVPDPGSTAGTTKFLREDGTWQVPAVDISNKEDKMSIVEVTTVITTLTPALNTYYNILDSITTLTVTLPNITETTKVQSFALQIVFGSSPNFTIQGGASDYLQFGENYNIRDGLYEISVLYTGRLPIGDEGELRNIWSIVSQRLIDNY